MGPTARNAELVTERFDDGLVIYDQRSDAAHSLRPDVAAVWRLCDGNATPQQIASRLALDPELVECALYQLEVCDLLEPAEGAESEGFDFARLDRRGMLKRTAAIGGGVALISSVLVPASASAFGMSSQTFMITGTFGDPLTASSSPGGGSTTLNYPSNGSVVSAYCTATGAVSQGSPVRNAIEFDYASNGASQGQIAVSNNLTSGSVTAVVTRGDNVTTYPLAAGGGSTSSISVSNGTVLTVTVN